MCDIDNLQLALDLLNQLIDSFDDFGLQCVNDENLRRFEHAREMLRKAYVYTSPILYRKDKI